MYKRTSKLKSIRKCGDNSTIEIMGALFAYRYKHLNLECKSKHLEEIVVINS